MLLVDWRRRSSSRAVRNGIAARLGPRPPVVLYPSYRGKNRDDMVDAANALTAIIRGTASE